MTLSSARGSLSDRLVGRAREQAILRDALTGATEGQGGLVLIAGEAGIGKTALAEALCREASERGALVLVGRCYDLTETPPYGPWIELFGRYQPGNGSPALPEPFARRGTVGAVASQAALFRQVQDFLAALAAKRPIVLLLDDLHWADPASLDLLRVIARTIAALPLLILATYRSDEVTHDGVLAQLLPAFVREASARRLDLRRLEFDDMCALVAARYNLADTDAVRLAAHLNERAGGNPFFIGELLHTFEEERVLHAVDGRWAVGDLTRTQVPLLIRQVIERRLAHLDDEARRLLAIAAVIGQEIALPLWCAVAETDEDALLPAIERAVAAHLLEETSAHTGICFVHALIRETLYDRTSLPPRRVWHRRVGEALTTEPNPDPDTVANHFLRAGDTRAAEWLVQAGDRAQHAYAYLTAAQRYEAALVFMRSDDGNLAEQGWHLIRIARMLRYSNPRRGLTYLDEAARIAEAIGDRVLAIIATHDRANDRILIGDHARGLPEFRASVAALEALTPRERAQIGEHRHLRNYSHPLGFRGGFMMNLAWAGHFAEVLTQENRFISHARASVAGRSSGPSEYGNGFFGLGITHAIQGRPVAAQEASRMHAPGSARTRTCSRSV
ncbi:MAG: ATP-binding protein [Thermomicrobiales bacterium]